VLFFFNLTANAVVSVHNHPKSSWWIPHPPSKIDRSRSNNREYGPCRRGGDKNCHRTIVRPTMTKFSTNSVPVGGS
jgi:hypothetical protein